jgi:hypothetical protein
MRSVRRTDTGMVPRENTKVDEVIIASPAAVGNAIFLRGDKSLYCIEGQPATGGVAPATK